ncbi:MAG TPA: penicillin acylase family protein [Thermoleophilaceae bacterium]|nr:penicillin acylase family protein [Thermoleophilaceae bacterium]
MVRSLVLSLVVAALGPATASAATDYGRDVYNVLPAGEWGGLPLNQYSSDQLPLYDGLTPLWDQVTAADIPKYFKPERFSVVGKVVRTERPRKGLVIKRDSWDVPHVYAKTRDLVEFGAGWVTAEDRGLFIETIRGPARVAALDVPGLDAFSLATSLRQFVPSKATERFVASSANRLKKDKQGRRLLDDVDAYVAGINAYYKKTHNKAKPWTRNDVAAATSLIGAVFGKGGGREVASSRLLGALQDKLGPDGGFAAWRDLAEQNDGDSYSTTSHSFPYAKAPATLQPGNAIADPAATAGAAGTLTPADPPRLMSNALLVGAKRSQNGRPLFVMGPQVGYYYPGFLMELDLHGGGIDARGAAFPGVSQYVLLGRGKDFSFSATSASGDVVDQFLEELCNPDGSPATAASTHYVYNGKCRAMGTFNAGVLKGAAGEPDKTLSYHTSVHGPIGDVVTVKGKPYGVALARSTRGRDVESARFFEDLNSNKIRSAKDFVRSATSEMLMTFNWFYADNRDIAFASTGRLPIRANGVYPGLPTLGTGRYDWRGFLSPKAHPQAINPSDGVLLNWNNRPAKNWGAADDTFSWGSVQRVELFKGIDQKVTVPELTSVMNRAATQDVRAVEAWPAIKDVLATGAAPDALTQQAADLVSAWSAAGGSRLDRDGDGKIDDPGAAVLDAAWDPLATAVMTPVLGDLTAQLRTMMNVDNKANSGGTSYGAGWYSYVDKDLRSLLGLPVAAPFSRRYCGNGDLAACRDSLWSVLQKVAQDLAAAQGPDPSAWRADATGERLAFKPGLLTQTMRWANRPTFQQVGQYSGHRKR